jgi:3',5'-cyclic AMP phosphodiesterase CpdA
MRLAHFSDIHVTAFPPSQGLELKRLAATASYAISRRGQHFAGSEQRIAALLSDIDSQSVDHALCTGDLTGVSGAQEFATCAALFGSRLTQPERFSVLPGNHDRYVQEARGRFERHFSAVAGEGEYPRVKHLGESVTLVLLDSARPTSLTDSSGMLGHQQLQRLQEILNDASLKRNFVVLALHYGLLRRDGRRDRPNHGLRDDLQLMALVDDDASSVDVILHGHLHTPFVQRTKRRVIINAGSATDLHIACGYHVYDIDTEARRLTLSRRVWKPESKDYAAAAHPFHAGPISTRQV